MGKIKTLVIVSGYFNPIHEGHIEYLNRSKALGDFLFVIVNIIFYEKIYYVIKDISYNKNFNLYDSVNNQNIITKTLLVRRKE